MTLFEIVFSGCVWLLDTLAAFLGTTYVAVNIWIFCIIWPVLSLWAIWYILKLRKKLKKYEDRS